MLRIAQIEAVHVFASSRLEVPVREQNEARRARACDVLRDTGPRRSYREIHVERRDWRKPIGDLLFGHASPLRRTLRGAAHESLERYDLRVRRLVVGRRHRVRHVPRGLDLGGGREDRYCPHGTPCAFASDGVFTSAIASQLIDGQSDEPHGVGMSRAPSIWARTVPHVRDTPSGQPRAARTLQAAWQGVCGGSASPTGRGGAASLASGGLTGGTGDGGHAQRSSTKNGAHEWTIRMCRLSFRYESAPATCNRPGA